MNILLHVCILGTLTATVLALKCYKCDGVKGQDLPCDGASGKGKEVECDDKCGLLLETRLPLDRHGNVIGGDYRWRRGCVTDGHEITDNSEASKATLTGALGCSTVAQRSEDRLIVRHTLCLCNSTLCNEDKSPASSLVPSLVTLTLTMTSIMFTNV